MGFRHDFRGLVNYWSSELLALFPRLGGRSTHVRRMSRKSINAWRGSSSSIGCSSDPSLASNIKAKVLLCSWRNAFGICNQRTARTTLLFKGSGEALATGLIDDALTRNRTPSTRITTLPAARCIEESSGIDMVGALRQNHYLARAIS